MSEIMQDSPLVMKYRPTKLNEVLGRDDFVNYISQSIKNRKTSNMLLCGLQGSGKTLIADLAIESYYNGKIPFGSILKIDASTKNKVEEIRDEIIPFLKTESLANGLKKTLFLDEADYLTRDSQAALRKPIEAAMSRCWVIVACNYLDKIILPIQSRLNPFYFDQLPIDAISKTVDKICTGEGIHIEGDKDKIIKLIYKHCRGEIRFMINSIMEEASMNKLLNEDLVKRKFPSNNLFIKAALTGNIENAITIAEANPNGCLNGAIDYIIDDNNLKASLEAKAKLIKMIVEAKRAITLTENRHFEIPNLVYQIACMVKPTKKAA